MLCSLSSQIVSVKEGTWDNWAIKGSDAHSLTNWHANCKGTTHLACMRNKLYMKWVRDLHHPMPHITKKADSYADKFLRW